MYCEQAQPVLSIFPDAALEWELVFLRNLHLLSYGFKKLFQVIRFYAVNEKRFQIAQSGWPLLCSVMFFP